MFVTSIVAGSVGLLVSSSQQGRSICLDRKCFLRDVGFFMVTLVSLCLILAVGKIHLWGAIAYLSIYIVYSFVVATGEYLRARTQKKLQLSYALEPLLASKPIKILVSFSFPHNANESGGIWLHFLFS